MCVCARACKMGVEGSLYSTYLCLKIEKEMKFKRFQNLDLEIKNLKADKQNSRC